MTCIIGLTDGNDVWVGGDSFGGHDVKYQRVLDPKVFKVEVELRSKNQRTDSQVETMLIGGAGSLRMLQLLEFSLPRLVYDPKTSLRRWMVAEFGEIVRELFKARGFTSLIDDSSEVFNGAFLVGFRGQLFTQLEDFSVWTWLEQEHATGAGEDFALGSLHATRSTGLPPEQRIMMALEASAEYSPAVCPPFHILSTQR